MLPRILPEWSPSLGVKSFYVGFHVFVSGKTYCMDRACLEVAAIPTCSILFIQLLLSNLRIFITIFLVRAIFHVAPSIVPELRDSSESLCIELGLASSSGFSV